MRGARGEISSAGEAVAALVIGVGLIGAIIFFQRKPDIAVTKPTELQGYTVKSHGAFAAGEGNRLREIVHITETASGRKFLFVTGCGGVELTSGKHQQEE